MRSARASSWRCCGWLALASTLILPVAAQNLPGRHGKTAAAEPAQASPAPPPTNLLQETAKPATVTEHGNALSVKADNASLSDILRQVAAQTGMKLEGLGGDERVFGSFGPAAPREVLTSLLNGTRYNVLMVGALANGAPRQLVLMRKTESGAQPGQPQPQAQPGSNPDEDETGSVDDPEAVLPAPSIEPAVIPQPGVPEPPAPTQAPPRPGQPDQPPLRTPQQFLQQIQQQQEQTPNAADPPQSAPPQ